MQSDKLTTWPHHIYLIRHHLSFFNFWTLREGTALFKVGAYLKLGVCGIFTFVSKY